MQCTYDKLFNVSLFLRSTTTLVKVEVKVRFRGRDRVVVRVRTFRTSSNPSEW